MLQFGLVFLLATISCQVEAKTIGALYTATNLNTANAVQVYAMDETGAVAYMSSVATDGMGSSAMGGDSLFSQDSLVVQGNFLFVVNAGSATLTLFSISPSNPLSITKIMSASTAGGALGLQYPIAVSVNPVQPIACVLSGGAMNGITCFTYDTNGLTPINGLAMAINQPGIMTPPAGPTNTFSDLQWTDDGAALIVSYKGHPTAGPGFVLSYPVTGATAATKTFGAKMNTTIPGAVGPFSITPVRPFGTGATAGNYFFVTDPMATSVDTFSIVKSTAVVTGMGATTVPTGGICWSEMSPTTGSFVAIGHGFSQLTFSAGMAVTVTNSVLFPGGAAQSGIDSSIAAINGMDYLFVLSPGNSSVFVYSLPSASSANYIGSYPLNTPSIKHQGLAFSMMMAPSMSSSSSSTGMSMSSSSTGRNSGSLVNPTIYTGLVMALVSLIKWMWA